MNAPQETIRSELLGTCPVPQSRYEHILLGHGSGGQLTAELIQRLFVPAFDNEILSALEDLREAAIPPEKLDEVAGTADRPLASVYRAYHDGLAAAA